MEKKTDTNPVCYHKQLTPHLSFNSLEDFLILIKELLAHKGQAVIK